jgi:hypothetical protein
MGALPLTQQPQPRCGLKRLGTDGSISSRDHDDLVALPTRVDTSHRRIPAAPLPHGRLGEIGNMLDRIDRDARSAGVLDCEPGLAAQRIIDIAVLAASRKVVT